MSAVKQIRQLMELSQAELGAGIGCSQANVSFIESGGQEMRPDLASRLIAFAETRGWDFSFDHVYGRIPVSKDCRRHGSDGGDAVQHVGGPGEVSGQADLGKQKDEVGLKKGPSVAVEPAAIDGG